MDLNAREEETMAYWESSGVVERLRQRNSTGRRYYFLDGPPYVTGDLHPGHIWVKTLKDLFVRYKRYRGFNVIDRAGYDVHGLPIENKVEKELGVKSKKEIEERIGVDAFVGNCKRYVEKYVGRMDADYARYGISLDFKNPYLPYTMGYMETAWGMFKAAADNGFLYEGKKTLIYCPHCETSLSQGSMEVEYKDVDDVSIFVAFRVDSARSKTRIALSGDTYLAVWTTTPWTLPANVAIAANPKALYVMAKSDGKYLILAKERLDAFSAATGMSLTVIGEFSGTDLDGIFYTSPLEAQVEKQVALREYHKVVFSEELVSMGEGTGLVHIAPGHGIDDYNVGVKNRMPIFSPLNPDATYSGEAGVYAGLKVPEGANRAIIRDLQGSGALLGSGTIRHSYPHCWRCDSKLIFMATSQWFLNVQRIKRGLLRENKRIKWHPEEVGGWQNDILSNSPDWCISRQRYWGIPMPIWRCSKCGEPAVIGSLAELKGRAKNPQEVDALTDLHRPSIDGIALVCACGGEMWRIPDVLDVWFDSSIAFRASLTPEQFGQFLSTELVVEYIEQIRGWFQYVLKTSMMVYGRRPFNHIVVHGIMFGTDGRKMSKSFGNYKPLSEMTKLATADAFRMWCVNYNPIMNRNLNEVEIRDAGRLVTIMYNIPKLIADYSIALGREPKLRKRISTEGLGDLDAWMLSRTESIVEEVTGYLDGYEAYRAAAALKEFVIEDLSRFYLKLAKKRVLAGDRRTARLVLEIADYALYRAAVLCSPITPFVAEAVYRDRYAATDSIFLEKWPRPNRRCMNKALEDEMGIARDAIKALLAAREKAGISLRQPISTATVEAADDRAADALRRLSGVVESSVNAKGLVVKRMSAAKTEIRPVFAKIGPAFKGKAQAVAAALKEANADELVEAVRASGSFGLQTSMGSVEVRAEHFAVVEVAGQEDHFAFKHGRVSIDKNISSELKEEALVREFERFVQLTRKAMGLSKADMVTIGYEAGGELGAVIGKNAAAMCKTLSATKISAGLDGDAETKEFDIDGDTVKISVKRLADDKAD